MQSTSPFHAGLEAHLVVARDTLLACEKQFDALVNLALATVLDGGKILLFGNGGSAADAQHIVAELVVRFRRDRRAIPAIALTTDTSVLTACANDLGYGSVFARQIEALGNPGDLAIGITTSGKSASVLSALGAARERRLRTAVLTGGADMPWLADLCNVVVAVPSTDTARIQEMHITLAHLLCEAIEGLTPQ